MSLDICILVFVYDCSVLKQDLLSSCLSGIQTLCQFDMRLSHIIREVFKKIKTQFACIMQIIAYNDFTGSQLF